MASKYDNRQLIQGIASHDRTIIRYLLQTSEPVIMNVLMKRNATPDQAEDVFMDSLEAIYREIEKNGVEATIEKLQPRKAQLQTYLTRININLFLNQQRRNKEQTGVTEVQELLYKEDETITTHIHEVEQRRLFLEKMKELEAGCRQILKLFFAKKSMKEIAVEMDISEPYAKQKKFRCKRKLIESIQRDERFLELQNL